MMMICFCIFAYQFCNQNIQIEINNKKNKASYYCFIKKIAITAQLPNCSDLVVVVGTSTQNKTKKKIKINKFCALFLSSFFSTTPRNEWNEIKKKIKKTSFFCIITLYNNKKDPTL